ncbi:hypothetical protein [Polaribacter glomeratus]|uniref:Uncharacterized protein n=1 Tax=Polaribacter glomeratus TaxID=102 RepID=A0A2S7WIV1_9FLAO|nr:hypothetical protein [Polaribacter glomeratus]PQJ77222.1 hypothetical protein BTO16_15400 [Polaribacter glomeratus]TXD65129.1 hypothetical protein ESX12_11675 [Polaribacter glomeratus]
MKTKITKFILLFTASLFFISCKSDCNHEKELKETQNSERPSQAITYPEMASMFKEYDNGQRVVLNEYISKKSEGKDSVETISQFYSLSEIKQYIAYIERLSKEKEIDLTGIRIFTSAYPSDYKIKEYQNRVCFILAPTTNIGDKKNIAYEPLESDVKKPVSMKSILDKYADVTTRSVNRAAIFSFNIIANDNSSALNRGNIYPPY